MSNKSILTRNSIKHIEFNITLFLFATCKMRFILKIINVNIDINKNVIPLIFNGHRINNSL